MSRDWHTMNRDWACLRIKTRLDGSHYRQWKFHRDRRGRGWWKPVRREGFVCNKVVSGVVT